MVCARTRCLLGFTVTSSVGFSPKKTAGVGAAQAEVPGDLRSSAAVPLEQGTETSSVHPGPGRLPSPISGWDPLQNPHRDPKSGQDKENRLCIFECHHSGAKGKQDHSRRSTPERVGYIRFMSSPSLFRARLECLGNTESKFNKYTVFF